MGRDMQVTAQRTVGAMLGALEMGTLAKLGVCKVRSRAHPLFNSALYTFKYYAQCVFREVTSKLKVVSTIIKFKRKLK